MAGGVEGAYNLHVAAINGIVSFTVTGVHNTIRTSSYKCGSDADVGRKCSESSLFQPCNWTGLNSSK